MKLEEATSPFYEEFNLSEILFISDIERFTKESKEYLLNEIKNKEIKLIVFLGDILSFLNKYKDYFLLLDSSDKLIDVYHKTRIIKDKFYKSKIIVGMAISDYIKKSINKNKEEKIYLKTFKKFVEYCKKHEINMIYYSGNHDYILDGEQVRYLSQFIPILEEIWNYDNLYIPYNDLELIKLNKELFLTGLHTHSDELNCNEYPKIMNFINSLGIIESPEKIIFVSHIPGKLKHSNLGSKEITLLKKKFKFKYHFHGHCKDYNGQYIEEGIPTKSVHFVVNQ